MSIDQIIQVILFGLFALLTAALAAVTGPTYDNILVPELDPGLLFPPLPPTGHGGSIVSLAATFSNYVLVNLVDPLVVILVLGIGLAYLARASWSRYSPRFESMFPRLLIAVLLANFTVPVAGALLGLAGATFSIVAQFDGGAWKHWVNLAGYGGLGFSWDNGVVAFVLSFVLFALVLALAVAVAFRNAMLGVLLVLLPIFTLLWPIPSFESLARRAWRLFGELAFWPSVLVIPLELAVRAPSILLLIAFLAIALGSPVLLSSAGTHLSGLGFPSAGPVVSGRTQRGLAASSQGTASVLRPVSRIGGSMPTSVVGATARTLGTAAFPTAVPLLAAEFLGRGAAHLIRHVKGSVPGGSNPERHFPPVRRGGGP